MNTTLNIVKGETMKLLNRLFPKAVQLEEATKRAEDAEAELSSLRGQHKTLWESYYSHDATIKTLRSEAESLKAKIREQTDADLLLVSLRIAATIQKGQKPAASDIALQQSLISQQSAYRQYYESASSYSGSLLAGLGLGNVLGR